MDIAILSSIIFSFAFATILACLWMVLDRVWFKPKKLEMMLRKQGFSGNPYRLVYGDTKEMFMMSKQAKTKPINLSDDIAPRVLPFFHHIIKKYGLPNAPLENDPC